MSISSIQTPYATLMWCEIQLGWEGYGTAMLLLLWGDWRHRLRYPNWRPFIYQKAVFYPLAKLSTRSSPNAYWLIYIVHTPILNIQLTSLAVHDFSLVCPGHSAKVLCCNW